MEAVLRVWARLGVALVLSAALGHAACSPCCVNNYPDNPGCPAPPELGGEQDQPIAPAEPTEPPEKPTEETARPAEREGPSDPPSPDEKPAPYVPTSEELKVAQVDLEELQRLSRSKAINEALHAYMTAVAAAYGSLEPPKDEEADEQAAFLKARARFRKGAEKALLRCLAMETIRGGRNIREDVNQVAAHKLGDMAPYLDERGRAKLSKSIVRVIERNFEKSKYGPVGADLLDATFGALAKLGDERTLEWMTDEYADTRARKIPLMRAAHKAMPQFQTVPGKQRYKIVREFLKTFERVERRAALPQTIPSNVELATLWADIGPGVIRVVQYFSGAPIDSGGKHLVTLRQFRTWFRNNKNRRKAPWVDPK